MDINGSDDVDFFCLLYLQLNIRTNITMIFQGANTSTDEDSHSSGRRTTPMASFTRGATFTRSLSRPEPAGRARPHTPTRLPAASSSRPRTPGLPESSQLPRRTATLNRTASHTVSQPLVTGPLFPLCSLTFSLSVILYDFLWVGQHRTICCLRLHTVDITFYS